MFELSKQILSKVSFDRSLFRKELAKSLNWIHPKEKTIFKMWVFTTFGSQYQEEIIDVFKSL